MYKTLKKYYQFLDEQKKQKEEFLKKTKEIVQQQMDKFMSKHGWSRKGKGQKMFYTKKFNGKDVIIEYRYSYVDGYRYGGLNEFITVNIEKSRIKSILGCEHTSWYFKWNEDFEESGFSLNVIMKRMEDFYKKYTNKYTK